MTSTLILPFLKTAIIPFLFSLTASTSGSGGGLSEGVDLIELNHFYDRHGKHQYDQIIFYEWSPDYRRFQVIEWKLVENDLAAMPHRRPKIREYVVSWYDEELRIEREVHSRIFRQSWSQIDPERANKQLIDEKYRVSLLGANDCSICLR